VRDPQLCFDTVSLALLAELSKHVPEPHDLGMVARPARNWGNRLAALCGLPPPGYLQA
jgi:hypothetical protein